MDVIPAVDIRGGKCVRLYQGDYDRETVFSDDPVAVAANWHAAGAIRLHIIDLDGAANGDVRNIEIVKTIVQRFDMRVQLGGGVREATTVQKLLDIGVERVILGTAAIETPELIENLCKQYEDAVVVGIDVRDGYVATHGWKHNTEVTTVELGRHMVNLGVKRILHTDIQRDGTLTEPNYGSITELISRLNVAVVAAGGISKLDHLHRLSELGVDGVVLGRALYTGDVNLKDALTFAEK